MQKPFKNFDVNGFLCAKKQKEVIKKTKSQDDLLELFEKTIFPNE